MDRKQGFFAALKEEVVRGLSPARSRAKSPGRAGSPMSGLLRRRKQSHNQYVANPEPLISRSGSLRPVVGETLTPLMEGPDPDGSEIGESKRSGLGLGHWMKGQLSRTPSVTSAAYRRSDLRLLLGVMGAPLAPVHVSTTGPFASPEHQGHSHCEYPSLYLLEETSSAQYILQQYTAASGGQKLQNSIRNAYAMGKVKMIASEFETATRLGVARFMLAAMASLSGGTHPGWERILQRALLGPLRRALQGLDPRTTASMFADARCIGEKKINGEDCFILKLCADPQTLKARSEGPAEIIRHVLFGYFSQKTGLLVHMEDSHLTRIQSNGGDAVYWETTINSFLEDYRPVEGIMIAHSGRSIVTLFRFGEMAMSHTKTRMEETWTIEEVAFNVPGLSVDCFIPPADLRSGSISEACELPHEERGKSSVSLAAHRAKVAALEKTHDGGIDNVIWRMEV
ncbi:hypothetical protein CK203_031990 [Vitis vinifera]|uniref:Uncharacterized protein n=1 Tax=Vitis vinifera TaxID=29760 RepID=A0A438FNE1_VITVI|nr:hypothetical protein CK203_031990 [Vitis vinifera]